MSLDLNPAHWMNRLKAKGGPPPLDRKAEIAKARVEVSEASEDLDTARRVVTAPIARTRAEQDQTDIAQAAARQVKEAAAAKLGFIENSEPRK